MRCSRLAYSLLSTAIAAAMLSVASANSRTGAAAEIGAMPKFGQVFSSFESVKDWRSYQFMEELFKYGSRHSFRIPTPYHVALERAAQSVSRHDDSIVGQTYALKAIFSGEMLELLSAHWLNPSASSAGAESDIVLSSNGNAADDAAAGDEENGEYAMSKSSQNGTSSFDDEAQGLNDWIGFYLAHACLFDDDIHAWLAAQQSDSNSFEENLYLMWLGLPPNSPTDEEDRTESESEGVSTANDGQSPNYFSENDANGDYAGTTLFPNGFTERLFGESDEFAYGYDANYGFVYQYGPRYFAAFRHHYPFSAHAAQREIDMPYASESTENVAGQSDSEDPTSSNADDEAGDGDEMTSGDVGNAGNDAADNSQTGNDENNWVEQAGVEPIAVPPSRSNYDDGEDSNTDNDGSVWSGIGGTETVWTAYLGINTFFQPVSVSQNGTDTIFFEVSKPMTGMNWEGCEPTNDMQQYLIPTISTPATDEEMDVPQANAALSHDSLAFHLLDWAKNGVENWVAAFQHIPGQFSSLLEVF